MWLAGLTGYQSTSKKLNALGFIRNICAGGAVPPAPAAPETSFANNNLTITWTDPTTDSRYPVLYYTIFIMKSDGTYSLES